MINEGPDAGAFHHHLFCREKPDLCTQMTQQTKPKPKLKGEKIDTAGLPLKKRFKSIRTDSMSKPRSRSTVSTSSDGDTTSTERSSPTSSLTMNMSDSSNETSVSTARQSPARDLHPTTSYPIPVEPLQNKQRSDPVVVAVDPGLAAAQDRSTANVTSAAESVTSDALRQRNQMEVLRASQAMLRHAYMKALKEEEYNK